MPRVQIVYSGGKENESSGGSSTRTERVVKGDGSVVTKTTVSRRVIKSSGESHTDDKPQVHAADSLHHGHKKITAKAMKRIEDMRHGGLSPYQELLKEMRGRGRLWEDPDFPADSKTMFPKSGKSLQFKRPKEISDNPSLIKEGISRNDVNQGELGDCWVLAAVASLCSYPQLFENVVPTDQGFGEDYIGAFHFRFYSCGKWEDIIVDDRLPVSGTRLRFMHSKDKDEFWPALLEKAYAKLNGSYETLSGGSQAEAMEDFTGGLCQVIDFNREIPQDLFSQMCKNLKKQSLMGCCCLPEGDSRVEGKLSNGLYTGHAYSVTDARTIEKDGKNHDLVRIRNPWGNAAEWNGAWSDSSREWKAFNEKERTEMGITFEDDGEFWMSFDDFKTSFTKLEVCHLSPDCFHKDEMKGKKRTHWEMCIEDGSWQKNVNAGGCPNFRASFWTNPQYRIEVVDPDEDDEEDMGTIMVGLMQKDMRKKNLDFHTIGYIIYQIKDPNCGPLDMKFFRFNRAVAKSAYTNLREVEGRHRLKPGHYVIVPTTFNKNDEADFLLRIFSEKPYHSEELDTDNTMGCIGEEDENRFKVARDTEEERELEEEFRRLAGNHEHINAHSLRSILNARLGGNSQDVPNFSGFNVEACRSMIALKDVNETGKMEFDEFIDLWRDLQKWKIIFKEHDYDKGGSFDAYEFRDALKNAGFKVSNKLFTVLANRYACPDSGTIFFEDFILSVVRLKNAFETLQAQPKDAHENLVFHPEEYLRVSMYV